MIWSQKLYQAIVPAHMWEPLGKNKQKSVFTLFSGGRGIHLLGYFLINIDRVVIFLCVLISLLGPKAGHLMFILRTLTPIPPHRVSVYAATWIRCRFDVGPPSQTVGQHRSSIGSVFRVCPLCGIVHTAQYVNVLQIARPSTEWPILFK